VNAASPHVHEHFDMTSTSEIAGFAELYERNYEAVFRAAMRVTGNPADAEDVLQTVFLRVLDRGRDIDAAALPAAYFTRAAINAAVDLLRRRTVHAETAYDDQVQHAAPEAPPLLKEHLRRAIATLQSEDAALFLLRHLEGLSIEELAEAFGLEKNNVAVKLHRIRLRLRTEMER
jgi:RNA polymerase sigma-70 factor (ECF subfamily)